MTKADRVEVRWETEKKHWMVRIQIGEEVIRRQLRHGAPGKDAADDALRTMAVQVAADEGFEAPAERVAVVR